MPQDESLEQRLVAQLTAAMNHENQAESSQNSDQTPSNERSHATTTQAETTAGSLDDQLYADLRSFFETSAPISVESSSVDASAPATNGSDTLADSLAELSAFNMQLGSGADAETLRAVQSALLGTAGLSEPISGDGDLRSISTRIPSRPRRPRHTNLTDADKLRIREENRARKKRWRDAHAIRNKDNDLRARILRRAQHQFGEEDSPAKAQWIEQEYLRRREKRLLRPGQPGVSKYSLTTNLFNSIAAAAAGSRIGPATRRLTAPSSTLTSAPSIDYDTRPLSQQTRLAAGTQLSRLFRESNAILEQHVQNFQGAGAPHMPLPSPDRPGFSNSGTREAVARADQEKIGTKDGESQEPKSFVDRFTYSIRGLVSLGAPPNLASLMPH